MRHIGMLVLGFFCLSNENISQAEHKAKYEIPPLSSEGENKLSPSIQFLNDSHFDHLVSLVTINSDGIWISRGWILIPANGSHNEEIEHGDRIYYYSKTLGSRDEDNSTGEFPVCVNLIENFERLLGAKCARPYVYKKFSEIPIIDGSSVAIHLTSRHVQEDEASERQIIEARRLAMAGNAEAQAFLSKVLFFGLHGSHVDQVQAIKFAQSSAHQGNSNGQLMLGLIYLVGAGWLKQDYEEAARLFSAAAKSGNPYAQFQLGKLYLAGSGVSKNNNKAYKLFRASAEQGESSAQLQLGQALAQGSIEQQKEAVSWWTKAAKQGDAIAQYNLAVTLLGERFAKTPVPLNRILGVEWMLKSANQNYARAQYHLGKMYYFGRYIKRDKKEGIKLIQQAAIQGLHLAEHVVGQLYELGEIGEAKDPVEALLYYKNASDKGLFEAKKSFERLRTKLLISNASSDEDVLSAFQHLLALDKKDSSWIRTLQFILHQELLRPKVTYQLLANVASTLDDQNVVCNHAEASFISEQPYDSTINTLNRCIQLAPSNNDAYIVGHAYLGVASLLAGHTTEAKTYVQKFRDLIKEAKSISWNFSGAIRAIKTWEHVKAPQVTQFLSEIGTMEPQKSYHERIEKAVSELGL